MDALIVTNLILTDMLTALETKISQTPVEIRLFWVMTGAALFGLLVLIINWRDFKNVPR